MTKKKGIILVVIGLCAVLLAVMLATNVSIGGAPTMAGGCVCISWDKWDMMRADKIVLALSDESYTITDPELIRALAEDTLTGDYTNYCCAKEEDGWIEIYRGDRLLRRMRYIENHNAFAYEADGSHWVLFGNEGHAFLEQDTIQKLGDYIGENSKRVQYLE